jgi:hypothetical protein
MALKILRIGALENITQYDSADYDAAIETDQPIRAGVPVSPNDVLRLGDIGAGVGDVVGPAGATDSDIAEFDGITGKKIKDGGLTHVNVADAIAKKHTQGTDTALGALGTKNPPIDADKLIYRDSTSSDALVTSTWTQVKAFLKTYFDTLYALASHAISSHSDTSLAGISNNDLMQWDDPSSKWEPKSIAEVVLNQDINPNDVSVGGDLTLSTLTTKNPPIDADKVIYRDSTASDGLVTSTWTQIKAFLKTYFDTLYGAIANVIKGDGTAGRQDRIFGLEITPGGTPNTNISIAALTAFNFNPPTFSNATNLAASGTSGSFALSADGKTITMNITPAFVGIRAITVVRGKINTASATYYYIYPGISSDNLILQIEPHGTPGAVDWRTIMDANDSLRFIVGIITDS